MVRENGALSGCALLWQFPRGGASNSAMRRLIPATAAAFVLIAAAPVPAPVPGGLIGTLPQGKYSCELPGNAGGPVRVAAAEFDFTVTRGSTYRVDGDRGSYLLTGDVVQMTRGKLKGLKLHRISDGFLRRIRPDGQDGELRCVLAAPGNS